MPRRPKRPPQIDDSPEALERAAKRRRARERDVDAEQRRIKAERAQVLHSFLHRYGSAGLIVVEGVSDEASARFREGFEVELDKRLLVLPADGNIQGEERDASAAERAIEAMSSHRDSFGAIGVLGFEGVDFSGQSGRGTPAVYDYVEAMLEATHETPRDELAVVAFGEGHVHDMPTSALYDHKLERGIVSKLQIILGLDPRGEPNTVLEPGLSSQFVPRHYAIDPAINGRMDTDRP